MSKAVSNVQEFNVYRITRRPKGTEEPFKRTNRQLYLNWLDAQNALERIEKADKFWGEDYPEYTQHDYRLEYQTIYDNDWSVS